MGDTIARTGVGERGAVPHWRRRAWALRALGHCASFEVAFALFVCAGAYKAFPPFSSFPVDITLLTAVISMASGGYLVARRRVVLQRGWYTVPLLMAALGAWMLVSLLWTSDVDAGIYKAAYLLTASLWSLAGAVIIAHQHERTVRFLWTQFVISWGPYIGYRYLFGSLVLPETVDLGYLNISQMTGVGFVIAITYTLWGVGHPLGRMVLLGLSGLLFQGLMQFGGRGPLVAAAAIPLVICLRAPIRRRGAEVRVPKGVLITALVVALGIPLVAAQWSGGGGRQNTTLVRLAFARSSGFGGRMSLYHRAWNLIGERPLLGFGVSGFHRASGVGAEYPHNVFLEAACEVGVPGLLLAVALFGYPVWLAARNARGSLDPTDCAVMGILVYLLVQSMKSGDVASCRHLYSAMGLAAIRFRAPRTSAGGVPGDSAGDPRH